MSLTAQTVVADVRTRTNLGPAQNPSDAALVSWVNASALHLYDLVIDQELYVVTIVQVQLTGSSNLLPLPSDFYRLRGLERQNGQYWTNIDKLPYSQRNASSQAVNGLYQLRYYPTMPPVTSLSSPLPAAFDGTGWWEWVSLDVCATVMRMLKQDPSPFEQQLARVQERVMHAAPNRNVDAGLILDPWRGRQAGWTGFGPTSLVPGVQALAPGYGYVGPEAGNLIIVPTLFGPPFSY